MPSGASRGGSPSAVSSPWKRPRSEAYGLLRIATSSPAPPTLLRQPHVPPAAPRDHPEPPPGLRPSAACCQVRKHTRRPRTEGVGISGVGAASHLPRESWSNAFSLETSERIRGPNCRGILVIRCLLLRNFVFLISVNFLNYFLLILLYFLIYQ